MLGINLTLNTVALAARTLTQQAVSILRSFGSDAHVYMPGAATPVLGPELVVNGGFDSAAGWTLGAGWSVSGGVAVANSAVATMRICQTPNSLVSGTAYLVTFTCISYTSGGYGVVINDGVSANLARTGSGSFSEVIIAGTNASGLGISIRSSTTLTATFDNISVKEILSYTSWMNGLQAGNYLESTGQTPLTVDQPTGLVLGGMGSLGSDLLGNAGAFTSASGWALTQPTSGSVSISGGVVNLSSIDGSWCACQWGAFAPTAGKTYLIEFDVVSVTGAGVRVDMGGVNGVAFSSIGRKSHYTTAINGNLVTIGRAGVMSAAVDNLSVKEVTGIHASQATTANKPILRSSALGPYYWEFDGVNDSLSLGTPLFQLADDHCVIVGAKHDSSAGVQAAFAQTDGGSVRSGVIYFSAGCWRALWAGSIVPVEIAGSVTSLGQTRVIAARNFAGNRVLRQDSILQGSSLIDPGVGVATMASIGSFPAAAGNFLIGAIYPVIVIKGTVSDAQLLTLEKWVANASGVTI